TIPLSEEALKCDKIKTLSVAKLVGEAIMRSYRGDSVNSLFI
ncbi:MAG: phosphoribosylpyrophosphate synthetase, partial [Desulfobacterales bacterium]|nr:phosphoribosylpyrophosphate synthetase [Desulfobacterales bacterium]